MTERFLANPTALMFLVIALGYALGAIRLFGVSLGASAVLFVALVFGHFGLTVPHVFADLGVILFVYAVGLQAGPRFFTTFQKQGMKIIQIGVSAVLAAGLVAWLMGWLLDLSPSLRVGMFAGAMTSTPALAAALDCLKDPSVSVGYGIAYPFGIFGIVLFVQVLPRILCRKDPTHADRVSVAADIEAPILTRKFRVENPQCIGKSLSELGLHGMTHTNISRIHRGDRVLAAKWEMDFQSNDVVLAVGTDADLSKLQIILGPEVHEDFPLSPDVIAREVYVSEKRVAGKSLSELAIPEHFGVVVTRVAREDIELVPTGAKRLEIGDLLRIVGSPEDCEAFIAYAGKDEKKIHETTILPFAVGIVLGVLLAYLPIPIPSGTPIRLGLAGGPLFVALLLSYLARVGSLSMRTPYAARYILRELGLVFFLAGAGTEAGAHFIEVLQSEGVSLLFAGMGVTCTPILVAFALTHWVYGFDLPSTLGTVCGAKTSTPGLGAACSAVDSDEPALAYAAIYPIALIGVTVAAQILALMA